MSLDSFGNLGDGIGGFATAVLAVFAFMGGKSALHDWRERQAAERDLAAEQAKQIRLDRERNYFGWMPGALSVYGVVNVTDPSEVARATDELSAGEPTSYVLLRVTDSSDRAHSLRRLVSEDGFVAKAPTAAEYEVLQRGRPTDQLSSIE
ncbi:hypothetical protein [Nucisporomicrobium flavum]|uniref:hypothetical protein n=1 Tax=Nucisporomicrobium flavum TaxID=2785915 RepID=UPI0018F77AFF|nr:hypothetical protein [Nucisporomicrobium flavum]